MNNVYEGKGKKKDEEEEMASVGLPESAIYDHIRVSTIALPLILNLKHSCFIKH